MHLLVRCRPVPPQLENFAELQYLSTARSCTTRHECRTFDSSISLHLCLTPPTGVRRLFAPLGRIWSSAAVRLGMRQARFQEPSERQTMPEERARGPRSRTKTGKGRYMLLRTLDRFHGKHTSPLAGTLPFAFFSSQSPSAMGSARNFVSYFVILYLPRLNEFSCIWLPQRKHLYQPELLGSQHSHRVRAVCLRPERCDSRRIWCGRCSSSTGAIPSEHNPRTRTQRTG